MNIKSGLVNILRKRVVFFFILFLPFISTAQNIEQYELVSINFKGNASILSSTLETVIASQESPGWFSQFLNTFSSFGEKAVYFDSLLIQGDIHSIEYLYAENGYFEHEVKADYTLDTLAREAELTFTIHEGDASVFRSIKVEGLDSLPTNISRAIMERIVIDTTEIFTSSEVQRNVSAALSYLKDNGYVFAASQTPVVLVDTLNNRSDVELFFEPGEKYKISEIRVSKTGDGKDEVEEDLIKELVGIEPGTTYNYLKMRRGQIRLYRTNLFTSALVIGVTTDTLKRTIPLNISADIGKIHEFSPGVLVNDEEGEFNLGFEIGFAKKNFFGDARKVSLNLSTAAQDIAQFITNPTLSDTTLLGYADARLILEQPFLFGSPIETKLETYYTLQKRKDEYNAILYGVRLGLDFELPPYTYFSSFITYFNLENSRYVFRETWINKNIKAFNELRPIIDTTAINISKSSENINALLGIGLSANKANDFLFPTSGYNLSFTLEDGNSLAYLFSKITGFNFNDPLYYRVLASSSVYFPVGFSEKSALAVKFKTGYIRAYRGNKYDIPLNQRFYSGGSNSVRGWNTRELVPELSSSTLPENPTSQELEAILSRGLIPGGFLLIEGSIETRNNLIGNLGSSVFVDFGNTWNSYGNIQLDEIAVAIGFGLRYYSEIVPIRLDFGFKFYDPGDRRSIWKKQLFGEVFQFHLGIGEAF